MRKVMQKTTYVAAEEVNGRIESVREKGEIVQFNRITGVKNYLKKHGLKYFIKDKRFVSIHKL